MDRVAIFSGSFDPFTKGHLAVVESALRLFDRVIVGIGSNFSKSALMSVDKRKALIEEIFSTNNRVEVMVYSGLTVEFAKKMGATALVRGVRNGIDFEYERSIQATNQALSPEIATVMIATPAELAHVSSSVVRELLSHNASVEGFMPDNIDINRYIK